MPQVITVSIPDGQAARIASAFSGTFGSSPFGIPELKQKWIEYTKSVVTQYESERDAKAARDTAAANVASQISIT